MVNVEGPYKSEKLLVGKLRDVTMHVAKKVLIRKYESPRALKKHRKEF